MTDRLLAGKKIAVLLESEFIPEEIEAYQQRFPEIGATVHFHVQTLESAECPLSERCCRRGNDAPSTLEK
jgi:hypothetical protein